MVSYIPTSKLNLMIIIFIFIFVFIMWNNIYEYFDSNETSWLDKFLKHFNITKSISIMFLKDDVDSIDLIKKTNIKLNLETNLRFCEVIKNTFINKTQGIYHIDDFIRCGHNQYLKGWKTMQLAKENKYLSYRTLNKLYSYFGRTMKNNKYLLIAPTNWFIENNLINKINFNIFITNYKQANNIIDKYSKIESESIFNQIENKNKCETICEIIPLINSNNKMIVSLPCSHCKYKYDYINSDEVWIGMNNNQINSLLVNNQKNINEKVGI